MSSGGAAGQGVDNRKITNLPLNGRNPLQLMVLATGVQFAGSTLTYYTN